MVFLYHKQENINKIFEVLSSILIIKKQFLFKILN